MNATPRSARGGFTLLELLAVMTVIGVLIGIGVGFVQRGVTVLDSARAILRDQITLAATTARQRGATTEVLVQRDGEGAPTRVRARVLAPAAIWHLEPDERFLNERHRPQLTGNAVVAGRFGGAWEPDPRGRSTMFTLKTGSWLDLYDGFLLQLDVKLDPDERSAATLVRLGRMLSVGWDAELRPYAKLTLEAPGPRPGNVVSLQGPRPLPTGRWFGLRVAHDGSRFTLQIDEREQAAAPANGHPFQTAGDLLEISPGDAPVGGRIDEILLLRYELGDELLIPGEVEVRVHDPLGTLERLRFDRVGAPESAAVIELRYGDESLRGRLRDQGLIHWEQS